MRLSEREITEAISFTGPDGLLNRDAVGWTRSQLHDTSGIDGRKTWGRNKRWEYWSVIGERFMVSLTVSNIDYLGSQEVWVFDRETGVEHQHTALVPFGRGVTLPPSLGGGRAHVKAGKLEIWIDPVEAGTRLAFRTPDVSGELIASRPDGQEHMGVVVPWSDRRFQYTVKDVALPTTGTLVIDGTGHQIDAGGPAWGVLDHGRGRWPYDVAWNWAAGSGIVDGRRIGIQLGDKWTTGSGSTENCLFVDGRAHKISEELTWEYDTSDYLAPWRVHGELVDLTFTPFHDKKTRTNVGVIHAKTDQCFGHWAGWMATDAGEKVRVDSAVGFAEDVHNRW
jgi:hypothetical protein